MVTQCAHQQVARLVPVPLRKAPLAARLNCRFEYRRRTSNGRVFALSTPLRPPSSSPRARQLNPDQLIMQHTGNHCKMNEAPCPGALSKQNATPNETKRIPFEETDSASRHSQRAHSHTKLSPLRREKQRKSTRISPLVGHKQRQMSRIAQTSERSSLRARKGRKYRQRNPLAPRMLPRATLQRSILWQPVGTFRPGRFRFDLSRPDATRPTQISIILPFCSAPSCLASKQTTD